MNNKRQSQKSPISTMFVIGAIIFSIWAINFNPTSASPSPPDPYWKSNYPYLSNDAGYALLAASTPLHLSVRQAIRPELSGKITNEFGIRDDVMRYILDTIPGSNTQATMAAIKMAQYHQLEIGVTDKLTIYQLENIK